MQSIRSFLLRMGGLGVSPSKPTGGFLIRKKIGFVLSLFCGGSFLFVTSELAAAPIAITNSGSYTQNFDSLPTSGTSNVWSNDVTLAGWWAEQANGGAIAIIRAGDGGSNSGALYSFGTGSDTERALGSVSSGTPGTITFGVQLQNSTTSGQNLTLGDLQFTGEQWRNGGNTSSHQLTLWYRVSATPLTSLTPTNDTGWTQLSAVAFTSLQNTGMPVFCREVKATALSCVQPVSLVGVKLVSGVAETRYHNVSWWLLVLPPFRHCSPVNWRSPKVRF